MLSVHKTTVFFFKSTSKHEKQLRGTGTGRQFVLTARTKTIERIGTGRQFPPSLASLSATKFSLQLVSFTELTFLGRLRNFRCSGKEFGCLFCAPCSSLRIGEIRKHGVFVKVKSVSNVCEIGACLKMSGSRLTRKVTVEGSKKTTDTSAPRKSVFERLGPGALEVKAQYL